MYFTTADQPEVQKLRRWWTYLSQFRLKTFHLPGIKNELCDLMSRHAFNERFQVNIEELAQAAFQRMDTHIDLCMQHILHFEEWSKDAYLPEYDIEWNLWSPGKAKLIDGQMF